jgi:hypothetical protein
VLGKSDMALPELDRDPAGHAWPTKSNVVKILQYLKVEFYVDGKHALHFYHHRLKTHHPLAVDDFTRLHVWIEDALHLFISRDQLWWIIDVLALDSKFSEPLAPSQPQIQLPKTGELLN